MSSRSLLFTLVFVFSFAVLSFVTAKSSFAGWTCCTPYTGDQCNQPPYPCGVPSCSAPAGGSCQTTELKNPGTGTGTYPKGNECPVGTVSNACDSTTPGAGGGICNGATITPKNPTIMVNQSIILNSNAFALGPIGKMTAVSSVPGVGTVAPATTPLAPWTYGKHAADIPVKFSAIREGSSRVTTAFLAEDLTNTSSCKANTTVTVSGVAPVFACLPSASCTFSTRVPAAGTRVNCSMPKVTDAALLNTYGTPSYMISCLSYNAKGVSVASFKRTVANGVFPVFAIGNGVVDIQCSFRYCLTKNNVATCSAWGSNH